MSEDTTTPAADPVQAPVEAQPGEQPAEAVEAPSEPQQPSQQGEEPEAPAEQPEAPENSEDDDPTAYWAKKGIDITTPEGQAKAAKSYREAEQKMHQTTAKASELAKSLGEQPLPQGSDDPTVQQALEMASRAERSVRLSEWKQANAITPEQDKALGDYVAANPTIGQLVNAGHLSFDQLRAMSGVGQADPVQLKAQGKKEALETLANKQRATAPAGNASSNQAPTSNGDSLEELEARLKGVSIT